jgi:hypothetical protein
MIDVSKWIEEHESEKETTTHVLRFGYTDDLDYGVEPNSWFFDSKEEAEEVLQKEFCMQYAKIAWICRIEDYRLYRS